MGFFFPCCFTLSGFVLLNEKLASNCRDSSESKGLETKAKCSCPWLRPARPPSPGSFPELVPTLSRVPSLPCVPHPPEPAAPGAYTKCGLGTRRQLQGSAQPLHTQLTGTAGTPQSPEPARARQKGTLRYQGG